MSFLASSHGAGARRNAARARPRKAATRVAPTAFEYSGCGMGELAHDSAFVNKVLARVGFASSSASARRRQLWLRLIGLIARTLTSSDWALALRHAGSRSVRRDLAFS